MPTGKSGYKTGDNGSSVITVRSGLHKDQMTVIRNVLTVTFAAKSCLG